MSSTLIKPHGFKLQKSEKHPDFIYLLFDIKIEMEISPQKTWMINISNFRAFRNLKGNIQYFFPRSGHLKNDRVGSKKRSHVFLNADLLLDLTAYIETHFGEKLKSLNTNYKKPQMRFRAETPEEAIAEFEKETLT